MRKLLTAVTMAALLAPAAAEAKQPYLSKAQAKRITKRYVRDTKAVSSTRITELRITRCSRYARHVVDCGAKWIAFETAVNQELEFIGWTARDCSQSVKTTKYGNSRPSYESWDWTIQGNGLSCGYLSERDIPAPSEG